MKTQETETKTMTIKPVKYLLPAMDVDMGGLMIKQPLPTQEVQQCDPFLLLHHANLSFHKERSAKYQGVGPHPHRGFSPVTFVISGEIHHRDSRGNNQVAKAGEVQWMNAGAGIVHSERPTQSLIEQGAKQEIIQLWINSPAARKMSIPSYQYLSENDIPVFWSEDGKVKNKLVAGNYKKLKGNAKAQSELLLIWGMAQEGGQQNFELPIEDDFNVILYLIKGEISLKGYGLTGKENLVIFAQEGNQISISFKTGSQFLLLAGKPLNEPVKQYGPFVMNTQTEILQAMRDYQMGKMGILIEED